MSCSTWRASRLTGRVVRHSTCSTSPSDHRLRWSPALRGSHVGGRSYRWRRMYGRVLAVAVVGVQGHLIRVEAHVGRGLPALTIAGLPGAGIQDARERVRPAVESVGLEWPLRRVVINLSPAGARKEGPGFDLPIAMGVLAASAQVPTAPLASYAFAGELSLKGELVATPGILAVAIAAADAGLKGVVVPHPNSAEASLVEGIEVVGAPTLAEVVAFLKGQWKPEPAPSSPQ